MAGYFRHSPSAAKLGIKPMQGRFLELPGDVRTALKKELSACQFREGRTGNSLDFAMIFIKSQAE